MAERLGTIINRVLDDVQATREARRAPAPRDTFPLVKAMSEILIANDTDIGDGRSVHAALRPHFTAADIQDLSDHAVEMVRAHLASNPKIRRVG